MTSGSTRSLQMDRKKTREECVGAFNLISTDTEFESKVCQRRALLPNPAMFVTLILIAIFRTHSYKYELLNSSERTRVKAEYKMLSSL